ncbi:MAG: hypothetical protein GXP63_02415 [DPANN group archaeon]|nr:hypothetical protein [DPANN group archaeon]
MIRLVFSPDWFFNIDSLFEFFSLIVTVLISLQAFRTWKFTGEKKYRIVGLSFASISLSLLFKALTNVTVYNSQTVERTIGRFIVTYHTSYQIYLFIVVLIVLYRLFFLLGIWGFFNIVYQSKDRHQLWVTGILLVTIATFLETETLFMFHIIAAVILGFIVKYYLSICTTRKDRCMKKMAMAFSLLLLSQISYIFTSLSAEMYVVAEAFQLLGFIFLLVQYYKTVSKK